MIWVVHFVWASAAQGNKPLPEYDHIPEVSSSLFSHCEGTIKYAQVCAALKKKKKCSTSFTCKTKGGREGEGEGRGWFWHIFSAVIMDPSHRMICSYTWLTELSSINKHSNTSTCRYKRQISIVFRAQTPLRCLADLSLSLLSVSLLLLCTSHIPLAVHQRHLQSDV